MNTFEELKILINDGDISSSISNVIPKELDSVSNFRLYEKPIENEEFYNIYYGRMVHLTNIGSSHAGLKETLNSLKRSKSVSIRAAFFQKNSQHYCVLVDFGNATGPNKIIGMFTWEHT